MQKDINVVPLAFHKWHTYVYAKLQLYAFIKLVILGFTS
jgi:hypothetical protein